jgi:hypothetical protein
MGMLHRDGVEVSDTLLRHLSSHGIDGEHAKAHRAWSQLRCIFVLYCSHFSPGRMKPSIACVSHSQHIIEQVRMNVMQ